MTSSAITADQVTQTLTKCVKPRWKCPVCGATFKLCDGSRALAIDDRDNPEDKGEICVLPLPYRTTQYNQAHPEYEPKKQVEALLDWLRTVSFMDQLSTIDANAIREAIANTNYMVINRMQASCTVKFKQTKNITTWG